MLINRHGVDLHIMNKEPGTAVVMVLPVDFALSFGCCACGKTIFECSAGYTVGLIITEEDGTQYKYFVGNQSPLVCCGTNKSVPVHFATAAEAEKEEYRIKQHIDRTHTTEGLSLLELVHPSYN